ncbi:MAG: hypothetical protein U1E15_13665 [Hyphomicrobiales bacterium]
MRDLVLIPALGCSGALYAGLTKAFADTLRLCVHVPVQDRFEAMVTGLLAQAPERFIVLGTSMGGRLALETALAAPERVEGPGW